MYLFSGLLTFLPVFCISYKNWNYHGAIWEGRGRRNNSDDFGQSIELPSKFTSLYLHVVQLSDLIKEIFLYSRCWLM